MKSASKVSKEHKVSKANVVKDKAKKPPVVPNRTHREARAKKTFTVPHNWDLFYLTDEDWHQLKLRRPFDEGQVLHELDRKSIEGAVNGFCLACQSGLSRKTLKNRLKITKDRLNKTKSSMEELEAMVAVNKKFLVESIFGNAFTFHGVDEDFFKLSNEAIDLIQEKLGGCFKDVPKGKPGTQEYFLIPLIESLLQDLLGFSSKGMISRSDIDKREGFSGVKVVERIMTDDQFFDYLFDLIKSKTGLEFKKTSIDHARKVVRANHVNWQENQRGKMLKEKSSS